MNEILIERALAVTPEYLRAFERLMPQLTNAPVPGEADLQALLRAAEIGREAGLHFVYAGNLPGHVEEYENTFCPNCSRPVVERQGYVITGYHITARGTCPHCGTRIPGVWPDDPSQVQLNGFGFPLPVY